MNKSDDMILALKYIKIAGEYHAFNLWINGTCYSMNFSIPGELGISSSVRVFPKDALEYYSRTRKIAYTNIK